MDSHISRIKQDLRTIEQAIGRGPEYQEADVWASIGFGLAGLALVVIGIFPKFAPYPWPNLLFIVLLLGLPGLLSKTIAGRCVYIPFTNFADKTGAIAAALTAIAALCLLYWFRSMGLSMSMAVSASIVVSGLCGVAMNWERPSRRPVLLGCLGYIAIGAAYPYLPPANRWSALGLALAFAGLVGAAVLRNQLSAARADEQAAD